MAYELHHDQRSSHQRIARYVRSLGADPILDVGAASGQLGRLLQGSGLEIHGIEPEPGSADLARPFYRDVTEASIEAAELPVAHYRVVVCADVLEHTPDPVSVLRRLLTASTDDVRVVISLPNVAHLAARLLLLSGRFPQHDRGIFDRSHLHFYTRETAIKLVTDAGLKVQQVGTTPVPLEEVWPDRLPNALRHSANKAQEVAARFAPRAFAYQWLIVATRA